MNEHNYCWPPGFWLDLVAPPLSSPVMAAVHDSHVHRSSSATTTKQRRHTHITLPHATYDGVQLVHEYSNAPQRRYCATFLDRVPTLPC
ncbi:hypothetical protein BS17DRAFT_782583 [Gyrodon lividus]|nr:hypothetical protein BS17DRAFT_782583 [Gyrodon lividus]